LPFADANVFKKAGVLHHADAALLVMYAPGLVTCNVYTLEKGKGVCLGILSDKAVVQVW
jgi:hypothetical protein